MAGQSSRRKMKPDTTLVFTGRSDGHLQVCGGSVELAAG